MGFIINLNLFIATRLTCYGRHIHTVKGDTEVQHINVFISMVAHHISPLVSATKISVTYAVVLAHGPETKEIPGKGNDQTGFSDVGRNVQRFRFR